MNREPMRTPDLHTEEAQTGTRFEKTDAPPRLVVTSLAIIIGTLVVTFVITLGIQRFFATTTPKGEKPSPLSEGRRIPPVPRLQVHPSEEYPQILAAEEQRLNEYGAGPQGEQHIPISVAIDRVLNQIQIAPNAPKGVLLPPGAGRDAAPGLTATQDRSEAPHAER